MGSSSVEIRTGADGAGQLDVDDRLSRAYDLLLSWAAKRRRELVQDDVCAQNSQAGAQEGELVQLRGASDAG